MLVEPSGGDGAAGGGGEEEGRRGQEQVQESPGTISTKNMFCPFEPIETLNFNLLVMSDE